MLDGLAHYGSIAKGDYAFVLDMHTYGNHRDGVCYGCAATCTVMKLTEQNLPKDYIRSDKGRAAWLGFDACELDKFELAINSARCFFFSDLFRFFGLPGNEASAFNDMYPNTFMGDDWRRYEEKMRSVVEAMEEAGY